MIIPLITVLEDKLTSMQHALVMKGTCIKIQQQIVVLKFNSE